jgi:hypothetical protein
MDGQLLTVSNTDAHYLNVTCNFPASQTTHLTTVTRFGKNTFGIEEWMR